jgi:hypothetical protein
LHRAARTPGVWTSQFRNAALLQQKAGQQASGQELWMPGRWFPAPMQNLWLENGVVSQSRRRDAVLYDFKKPI